jgi:very-long-chain enoyl-CoA reductase
VGVTPRAHNVVSYGGALVVLPVVVAARSPAHAAAFFEWEVGLPVALWALHFARRAAEALWLHRYSKATFPWGDALFEYAYYWGFGTWLGWTLAAAPAPASAGSACFGTAVFLAGELGNQRCHRLLAALRPAAGSERPIPRGFLFERVSCPHYLFEITSWVGFALVVRSLAALCFLALGAAILSVWSWQRHSDYRRRFDGKNGPEYPRERRALIPFVF